MTIPDAQDNGDKWTPEALAEEAAFYHRMAERDFADGNVFMAGRRQDIADEYQWHADGCP